MTDPKTSSERVADMRQRNGSKTLSISGEAARAIADYQQLHGLTNRSKAIIHATRKEFIMGRSQEVYKPGSSLKGTKFRVMSDGESVRIQRQSPDSQSYRTTNTISVSEWEEFYRKYDLDNKDDPAPIALLSRPDPFK
jgi:hypothetical protein